MIKEVVIEDNKNSVLSYLPKVKSMRSGRVFKFNPGINIIIGKNGSGKSTLLKLISNMTLCNDSSYSILPNRDNMIELDHLYQGFGGTEIKDGVKVKSDYLGVTYNYITQSDCTKEMALSSYNNFSVYMNNAISSTGEKMLNSLSSLFEIAFSNNSVNFPLRELSKSLEYSNDLWKERFTNLLKYYSENRVKITEDEFEYTFLIDEPDRNLDIYNIDEIYNILSFRKPHTQIIAVIHNPILIYKLSKLDYINFIELNRGYLNKIKDVFNNL